MNHLFSVSYYMIRQAVKCGGGFVINLSISLRIS